MNGSPVKEGTTAVLLLEAYGWNLNNLWMLTIYFDNPCSPSSWGKWGSARRSHKASSSQGQDEHPGAWTPFQCLFLCHLLLPILHQFPSCTREDWDSQPYPPRCHLSHSLPGTPGHLFTLQQHPDPGGGGGGMSCWRLLLLLLSLCKKTSGTASKTSSGWKNSGDSSARFTPPLIPEISSFQTLF